MGAENSQTPLTYYLIIQTNVKVFTGNFRFDTVSIREAHIRLQHTVHIILQVGYSIRNDL